MHHVEEYYLISAICGNCLMKHKVQLINRLSTVELFFSSSLSWGTSIAAPEILLGVVC